MAQKLNAALPPDVLLGANFQVRFAALDPTSGAAVSGVVVSNAAILAEPFLPDEGPAEVVPLPPLYVSLPDEPEVATGG